MGLSLYADIDLISVDNPTDRDLALGRVLSYLPLRSGAIDFPRYTMAQTAALSDVSHRGYFAFRRAMKDALWNGERPENDPAWMAVGHDNPQGVLGREDVKAVNHSLHRHQGTFEAWCAQHPPEQLPDWRVMTYREWLRVFSVAAENNGVVR